MKFDLPEVIKTIGLNAIYLYTNYIVT